MRIKSALSDISGAFGDIGVFFPLAVALISANGFNPTALFVLAGLFYIASSAYFRITMPVQPLKAMAAIAIATGVDSGVINAAGIVMGLVLMLLALTGASAVLGRLFPVPVVRGIQLGLALMLVKASWPMVTVEPAIALAAVLILIVCVFFVRSVPAMIPILALGIVIGISRLGHIIPGPVPIEMRMPGLDELAVGAVLLVIPQIGLTFGNAIVATEATGRLLYGNRAYRLSLRNLPISMGIANIVSGFLGAAPMCHGCGGLTAHHKFGAANERSGLIIGAFFVALGFVLGHSALAVVGAFPKGILGVLLCYVGIQHGLFMRDIIRDARAMSVALVVALVGFGAHNLTMGFIAGFAVHYVLMGIDRTIYMIRQYQGGGNV